ncbi:MAG: beta-galactosidase [Anaerolineae bacterium]|nr:beta-galactosidase [Anaerolineae bacterium]
MFRFGVDYYPEHWPQERWETDARMMQEAGINTVRLAEFAWSYLEPQPDHFDFDWLDRALDILHVHGIQAVLGTPTASPPPWVMATYPDAYRVLPSGQRQTYGNRREYCPNHPGYRERSRIITQAMAEHYANHPAVIGWQIDNEFGDRCYCSTCQAHFHTWLQRKYGSLEALNTAWGTAFWSHVYTEWSQIPVPLETGGAPNPGLALDYDRFMSDSYVRFQQEQIDILRQVCPDHFITHNFMGLHYDRINYFDLAKPLDFVSWDNYPRLAWRLEMNVPAASRAIEHDTMRGLKGKNFWVMEEQSGSGGGQTVGITPRPGEIRLWTYQAIAHGADAILYFRWRTSRFGTEQYWHGVLDHDGQPRRRYREIQSIGMELQRIGDQLAGAETKAQVAIILCYDTRFAFQIQPNHPNFRYPELLAGYYNAFHQRNVSVDIVPPTADLSRYKVVIAPALYILPENVAANLRRYVENGGLLLTTARTGVKDEHNAVVNMPLPGPLTELCGVEVEEYEALPADIDVPLQLSLPGGSSDLATHARLWCDVLHPTTAEVVARYDAQYYMGHPAITLNRVGRGQVLYVGTFGDERLQEALVEWSIATSGLSPALNTPAEVEAVEKWQKDKRLLFLLNHADEAREVILPKEMEDILTGQVQKGRVTLPSKAVMILHDA